ncbi:hypothetical protein VTL71DRAFT_8129 [Oculimacula yallundae]|uniref:Uncharacterized protein n=1 Tax=Oculimacula yallundae TaxID=86028 RepID=A0ABR4CWN5_9HELO
MQTTYVLTLLPKSSPLQPADRARAQEVEIMAPVPVDSSLSYMPTAVVGAHLFAVVYLSLVVGRTIYRSYLALLPSSATRHREPLRKGHVKAFSVLAFISLITAGFFGVKFGLLSYRVWAAERGIGLPESIFGDKGAFRAGEHPGRFHLVRWLNDTPLYRDSLEIVAEKARHFWWSQQVHLGLISWSTYLALEGHRRKISNLWAFLALAQLVNLSFAQNLFFVAVLLTPVPLPENVRDLTRGSVPVTSSRYSHLLEKIVPKKQDGFLPKPTVYVSILLASFATTFLIPYAANTTSFWNVSGISKILPFSFLVLPYVIPAGWGTISNHPHESYSTYTTLFRIISTFSAALHLKSTAVALFNNVPESTYYRHSLLHPFREEHRTVLGRGSAAFGRIFGAMGEHPAVGLVATDVLLTGLSLGIWAAIRGLDATDILRSSIPFMSRTKSSSSKDVVDNISEAIKTEAKEAISGTNAMTNKPRRGPGRPKKSAADNNTVIQESKTGSTARQRRGVVGSTSSSGKGTNRTRSGKRSGEDDEYMPSDDERLDEGDEDTEKDSEIAAFVWGLLSVGGLGTGSSAVYGAETISR